MRVFALIVTTLCLAAVAQGFTDYQLECTRDEIGIRWPSYYSNSDYYVCSRVGGKQVKLSCNPGELFTFVLQACTQPGRFIPAPPVNLLPISSSNKDTLSKQSTNGVSGSSEVALPKPLYPSHELQTADILLPKEDKVVNGPPTPPTIELAASDVSSSPSSEASKPPTPPLPPTPEPTPPVVKKPVKVQPQASGKKQPTATNKKQPTKPEKKVPTPAKSAVKTPKKPAPPSKKAAPSKE